MLSLILPFVRSNWKLIGLAGAIILVGLYISILKVERNAARNDALQIQAEFDLYRTNTEHEVAKMNLMALQKESEQKEITENTAIAYTQAMERQNAYYRNNPNVVVKRVPVTASDGSGQVPTVTQDSASVDEGAANNQPGESGESTTVEDCAATTLQLLWLQDWAKKQELAQQQLSH